ncbi:TetR/AcrR family transcriptional regulator [Mycobacterium sp. ITM-2016-00316]|uniref:TetR/AcrR family transcriptional regulator n=1 Tax=Mycobacterium sp. ITM-2016-00316 TaxID=2099695 RepID=UPI000CF84F98|nr:TetR/AcrR family transcriptional regulator [Mycobacterium sp. ITM-2016-00316]WNG82088.1 TetR/AcrR family transcriptional regulator [Mycobacterium sp. ITM-2016-00316]
MPRNKRPQPPQEKRAEIVTAARELFVDAGYDATPMGRLAAAAGVAANTIYWYFEDKDAVLIAVLDEVMTDAWAQYQSVAAEPIPVRLLWVVQQLQQMSRLVSTVHARAERSPSVALWHDNFHLLTASLFRYELEAAGAAPDSLDAEVMIGVFTIEGLLMHPLGEDQQRAICNVLASRWIPQPPP